VEGGEAERRVISASMAAMGWVRRGSCWRWEWYIETMLEICSVWYSTSGGSGGYLLERGAAIGVGSRAR